MSESAPEPLAGYTVAVTAARRREEFGAALERRGARVVYAPAIQIVPLSDDSELRKATERCLAAPPDIVIATTGIGFRGWIDAAETWGLADQLTAAIGNATVLARGPKVRGQVRASGLREAWSPESESSSEVLDYLLNGFDLEGRRVVVQLHGEPLPDMVETLELAGAEVIQVPVYRWVPPEDVLPLRRLAASVADGGIDCLSFTSAPAVISFLRTAEELGIGAEVRAALHGPTTAAAVGPVTAGPLLREGIPFVTPARFRLGALVREIVEQVPLRHGVTVPAAGHLLEVRGQGIVVDGALVLLPAASMTLFRALMARPGQVVSRKQLLALTGGDDEHAVEVAIGRLRTALGDPRIVLTVVKRGYRLAYEPELLDAQDGGWRY